MRDDTSTNGHARCRRWRVQGFPSRVLELRIAVARHTFTFSSNAHHGSTSSRGSNPRSRNTLRSRSLSLTSGAACPRIDIPGANGHREAPPFFEGGRFCVSANLRWSPAPASIIPSPHPNHHLRFADSSRTTILCSTNRLDESYGVRGGDDWPEQRWNPPLNRSKLTRRSICCPKSGYRWDGS
jgi:hypothetical protein